MGYDYQAKIEAMLRSAEDAAKAGREAERDAFQAKADELILKWGIDVAMLNVSGKTKRENIVTKSVECGGIYGKKLVLLAHWVGSAMGTVTGYVSGDTYVFVGYASDTERAALLYTSLQLQGLTSMQAWWRGQQGSDPHLIATMSNMEKYIARRSFVEGFASTSTDKLRRQFVKTVSEAGTGTDLVLRNRKTDAEQWIADNVSTRTTRAGRSKRDINGASAGREAGRNADTGAGRLGQGRQALPQ